MLRPAVNGNKATLMLAKTAEKPKPNELLTDHPTMKRANN
jgi:hypothetical protein